MMSGFSETPKILLAKWSNRQSYFLLIGITLLCLLPFSGRAFHVDDPLFVWSGQQIAKHPLDPYGFHVVWDNYSEPMSEITKNPPLDCYYVAAIGFIAGWSERALHLGFLLPALALVLGTYRLSMRFTRSPLIATMAALLTPGVLVSATSVMCDVLMLAFWIWASVLWIEGLDEERPGYLTASVLLLTLAALTKYFGICLLPLLFTYSMVRRRRLGLWALYFLIPPTLLAGYQLWTQILYGHAMFSDALDFAQAERVVNGKASPLTSALIGVSFTGGCTLSTLLLAPIFWNWRKLAAGLLFGLLSGFALIRGWVSFGPYAEEIVRKSLNSHWLITGIQLTFAIAAGTAILWIGIAELRRWQDSDSVFLGLWVLGTFIFAAFLNWTINARSILPLIPAVGILLARRADRLYSDSAPRLQRKIAVALVLSGAFSLWLAKADADWANSAEQAAVFIHQETEKGTGTVWFQGHWGFQYYMQQLGAQPVDFLRSGMQRGDVLVVPENNTDAYRMPTDRFVASTSLLQIKLPQPISTMRWRNGAAFYSSFYGPLPFAFGPSATERYYVFRLSMPMARRIARGGWHGPAKSAQN
ncbi:MAG: ArnT family glycosyltransferase [Terriglobales bacterium]